MFTVAIGTPRMLTVFTKTLSLQPSIATVMPNEAIPIVLYFAIIELPRNLIHDVSPSSALLIVIKLLSKQIHSLMKKSG